MGADLNNIVKTQRLSDDHVQFLVYQILRGLKVSLLSRSVSSAIRCRWNVGYSKREGPSGMRWESPKLNMTECMRECRTVMHI